MNQINHRVARKMIQARLSLALPPSKGEILDSHLSSCPACQAYASRMQALETRLRQEPRANGRNSPAATSETTRLVLEKLRARQVKSRIYTIARVTVVSAGVLLLFLLFSTPQGHALRQSTTQGLLRSFTRILGPNEVQPAWVDQTPEIPEATLNPVPNDTLPGFSNECLVSNRPRCSVEQIRNKVDFPVKELGIIPPGMVFVGATGEPDHVYLLYETPNASGSIVLYQGRWTGGAIQAGGEISLDAAVETVQVGDYAAEYVKGAFQYEDGKPVYWDDQARMQHLRWVEDGIYIVMQIWGEPYGQPFDRDGVVALAESLTTMPVAVATLEQSFILPLEPAVIAAEPTRPPTNPDCESATEKPGHFCQVQAAEKLAGFNARELPFDPLGMKFSKATVSQGETETITMEFVVVSGGGYLYLHQGVDGSSQRSDWDETPTNVWDLGGMLRLRWREGERWFSLEKMGDPYPIEWLNAEEMMKLAESLVDERPADAVQPLDPEYLPSVEAAEMLAGFEVPTPALLPQGFELKRAVWADGIVRLIYGPRNPNLDMLYIFIGPVENHSSECPTDTAEAVQVGPWSGCYSQGIYDYTAAMKGQPTPTPVWDEDAPHWGLIWTTDRLWIHMWYHPPYDYGSVVDKETLVRIAESMR